MSVQWSEVLAWVKANELILGLLASAVVGTMPEMLPHWKEFPQWFWTWFRDAAKTFLNYRHGGEQSQVPPPTPKPKLPDPDPEPKPKSNGPLQLNG